jgi:hypothetical protein
VCEYIRGTTIDIWMSASARHNQEIARTPRREPVGALSPPVSTLTPTIPHLPSQLTVNRQSKTGVMLGRWQHAVVTHESKASPDDGLIVSDPDGEKFRIRWAKRGTFLRRGSAGWDGTASGLVTGATVTVLGKVFAAARQTWKVAVYRLVSPPRMKSEGPVYRETP